MECLCPPDKLIPRCPVHKNEYYKIKVREWRERERKKAERAAEPVVVVVVEAIPLNRSGRRMICTCQPDAPKPEECDPCYRRDYMKRWRAENRDHRNTYLRNFRREQKESYDVLLELVSEQGLLIEVLQAKEATNG